MVGLEVAHDASRYLCLTMGDQDNGGKIPGGKIRGGKIHGMIPPQNLQGFYHLWCFMKVFASAFGGILHNSEQEVR